MVVANSLVSQLLKRAPLRTSQPQFPCTFYGVQHPSAGSFGREIWHHYRRHCCLTLASVALSQRRAVAAESEAELRGAGGTRNRFSHLTPSSTSSFSTIVPARNHLSNKLENMERRSPIKDSIGSLSSSCGSSSGGVGGKTQPFMIGVAGGTASGKTTVCEKIMEAVNSRADLPPSSGSSSSDEGAGGPNQISDRGEKRIVAISEDSFYRELDEKESLQAGRGMFNFDHPDAFDTDTMMRCLADIREGKVTKVPEYDFKTNARMRDSQGQEMFRLVYPSDVVLLEGILVFYHKEVRNLFDMKLFVDTDADTRLSRRVLRDIEHRGRDLEHVLHQYTTLVKPAFEEFCLPTKKFADVIIPRGADNTVAITLVAQHIEDIIWRKNGGCDCKDGGTPSREIGPANRSINSHQGGAAGSGSPTRGSPFTRSRSSSDSLVR